MSRALMEETEWSRAARASASLVSNSLGMPVAFIIFSSNSLPGRSAGLNGEAAPAGDRGNDVLVRRIFLVPRAEPEGPIAAPESAQNAAIAAVSRFEAKDFDCRANAFAPARFIARAKGFPFELSRETLYFNHAPNRGSQISGCPFQKLGGKLHWIRRSPSSNSTAPIPLGKYLRALPAPTRTTRTS